MPKPQPKEHYRGFSLQSVCWGYRDIFQRTLEGLFEQGLIGPDREAVSREFFDLLKHADQGCFDHVLKEFLASINPGTRWLLDLPGLFSEVVNLGRELAESRLHWGLTFFKTLGAGGFGASPAEVRVLIDRILRLRQTQDELALAFLKGYRRLSDRLSEDELDLYLTHGLRIFHQNHQHGLHFMEGKTRSSENVMRSITRECRLSDVEPAMGHLLRALTGHEVEISDLGSLDSDELIERGSRVVCMYRWLYVPSSIRYFDDARDNRAWYMLITVAAASMLSDKSFCRVHGHPRYRTCRDLAGESILSLNLLQIVEAARVVLNIRARWPGARELLDMGISTEFAECPPSTPAEALLRESLACSPPSTPAGRKVRHLASQSVNVFHTQSLLQNTDDWPRVCPGVGRHLLRPCSFLPDFLYPGQVEFPPEEHVVADLKQEAESRGDARHRKDDPGTAPLAVTGRADGDDVADASGDAPSAKACFVYDEWSQPENDYYRNYCFVHEQKPEESRHAAPVFSADDEARKIRQVFERLKPDTTRREKSLPDGDYINSDMLVDYLVQKRHEPSPKVAFYEKPMIKQRDLATLVLLDVSGSTGENAGPDKVLDIEKRAALIFGQGLAALGDTFSLCGFSGNGRENCEYFVYKDFDEKWQRIAAEKLMAARPSNATRIGPALRHSGHRLSSVAKRQRLIILITDGKPMDREYDPNTRYAQYDVRRACEENAALCVNTFAISTQENTRADMEIMFPGRRFAILPDIRALPRLLPQLYLRLTL